MPIARSLLILLSILVSQTACADNDYQLNEVADGIYYHQGIHEDATETNMGAIANVGFIIGEQCVAVIDTGGSYLEGQKLKQALRDITDLPVCYVVNTHVHPDHILGNAVFSGADTVFVGHEKLPEALASRQSHYARQFSEQLGKAYDGTEFIAPDTLVPRETPLTLNLGGRQIVLTAYSTAHTDHDLTVLDKNTNTLWTGDLLFRERIPALDGSINGWIEILEQLEAQSFNAVIPGHGPSAQRGEEAGWQNILTYLKTIRKEIRVLINDLGTIEEATVTVGQEERSNWKLFEEYHRRNITAAFVELEWE